MPRELALPYVPIDPNIEQSERMDLFLEALGLGGDHVAPWYVVRLLLWAGRNRPDGNLGRMSPGAIARAAGWTGDAQAFLEALVAAKWLIEVDDGWRVEGWERHGGKVLDRREEWRKRKQRQRSKRHADVTRDKCGSHAGVTSLKGEVLKGETQARALSAGRPPDVTVDSKGLAELVAAANLRFGTLGGQTQIDLRNLCPIEPNEIDGVLATNARSWRYVAIALKGMRTDAAAVSGTPRPHKRAGWAEPSSEFSDGDVAL